MKKLTVFYDNWCPNCSCFVKVIKKLDWLNLIELKQLRNNNHIESYVGINSNRAAIEMASISEKWQYGYPSLYLIFLRIPIMWCLLPFFLLLKITNIGQYLYIQLAVNRKIVPIHCNGESCRLPQS